MIIINEIEYFKEKYPSIDSYWRSIILFGRNVASYKFALAESLLELVNKDKTIISLEDLAIPYSNKICSHIIKSPKQATSQSSTFLETCKKYNENQISYQNLIDITTKKGFLYVLDAFHIVNNDSLPIEFFKKDFTNGSKKIILTDNIFKLNELKFSNDFLLETESRWNLVETAWSLGISRNLLNVKYDNNSKIFFIDNNYNRHDVTSARNGLNGYQKGKCFYCFDDITLNKNNINLCDVDHFFPHILQQYLPNINLDGVWNLVLTCPQCNRGENGKFAKVPSIKYLHRLHKRNEFLINSYHPLRETIINQTGKTEQERISFLQNMDKISIELLIHRWETKEVAPATF